MGLRSWWNGPEWVRAPGPYHVVAASRMDALGPVLLQDWSFILSYLTRDQQSRIERQCSLLGVNPLELFKREPELFAFQREGV